MTANTDGDGADRLERLAELEQRAAETDTTQDLADALRDAWQPHDGGQAAVLEAEARFKVVACGRRWGKTELAAYSAVKFALEHPNSLVWWVAPNYNQADVGVRTVRDILPESVDPTWVRSEPKTAMFPTGSELSYRSADHPDTLRGVGLDYLVIDEAAMVAEDAWYQALRPTLADTAGGMMAISTPMARNWFYKLYERGTGDDHEEYAAFRYPTAANPYIDPQEIAQARESIPDRAFRQEYEAEFTSGSGTVFTGLDRVVEDYDWRGVEGKPPYATGVDFARHQDWTVVVTLDADGRLVHFDRLQDAAWPQIQAAVERAADRYRGEVRLDATRDNKIVADLEAAGVAVEPVTFTQQRKAELVEDLVTAVENSELALPASLETPLLRELKLFEYDVTAAGNVRYGAPAGFHDDCVDALALATSGSRRELSIGMAGVDRGGLG